MLKFHDDKHETSGTDDKVHYDAPGIVGWATLCGYVDITGADWQETTKRVNCRACLDVRDHVRGRL